MGGKLDTDKETMKKVKEKGERNLNLKKEKTK